MILARYFIHAWIGVSPDGDNNVVLPWLLFSIKICQKSLANTDDDDILKNILVLIIS